MELLGDINQTFSSFIKSNHKCKRCICWKKN